VYFVYDFYNNRKIGQINERREFDCRLKMTKRFVRMMTRMMMKMMMKQLTKKKCRISARLRALPVIMHQVSYICTHVI